jgi:hypothetical protein
MIPWTQTDGSYVNYGYDSNEFGQFISAVGNGGQSTENLGYLYDPAANLNKRTKNGAVTTFGVNNINQLTNVESVTYSYDWNGNLSSTSDYRSYSYDDENQLTRAEQYQQWRTDFVYPVRYLYLRKTFASASACRHRDCGCALEGLSHGVNDGQGRLRVRTEYVWLGSGWYPNGETRYIYDGRLVIQERNGSNTPMVSYTRGVDFSGSFPGAGGIGGLLARSHGYSGGSWSTHNFYHSDGNGNITYLLNSSQGMAALYRYDPYGRLLYSSGSLAGANLYRFSSKEIHVNSGLYYYGYRFYDPKWPLTNNLYIPAALCRFDRMDTKVLQVKYLRLFPHLNERMRRLVAAADAVALGRGGVSRVHKAAQLSRPTIYKGMKELAGAELTSERVRRRGGGRKAVEEKFPDLDAALERLVNPTSRGDPMNPLRWTIKSTRKLADELKCQGYKLSHPVVAERLAALHYSLQANAKVIEQGSHHPDRNAQFEHINDLASKFLAQGQPVISVDAKKKELVGQYRNSGREWQPQGRPQRVNVYDFIDESLGKAIPYGVYDLGENKGWVNVGRDHDTAAFAVESIRRWWQSMGQAAYPQAQRLLICADGGGSNGYRVRLWKRELQRLSDELGMAISVCHYPPGTSKWNKIEHRLFAFISQNWRGKPLTSHEVIIELIASTTTRTGLKVRAQADTNTHPDKIKVSNAGMESLNLERDTFHGEWNYTLKPRLNSEV